MSALWEQEFEAWKRLSSAEFDAREAFRGGWQRGVSHARRIAREGLGDDGLTDREVALVREGKLISAIKLVRDRLGCTLTEAKRYVERFLR